MGLVGRVDFASEGGGFGVHGDDEHVRLSVLDQAEYGGGEDICCLGGFAGGACELAHLDEVRRIDMRMAVDDIEVAGLTVHSGNIVGARAGCQVNRQQGDRG